jgi:hypothetical protein
MEISDFKMLRILGDSLNNRAFVAEVTITEGWWVFKKSRRVQVAREYGMSWFFLDTGEMVPLWKVDALEKASNILSRLDKE